MAKYLTTNFIDCLLANLNGIVAPIWNSLFCVVNTQLKEELLKISILKLINETPRLNVIWSEKNNTWQVQQFSHDEITSCLHVEKLTNVDTQTAINCIINTPIDLAVEIPLRIWLLKVASSTEDKQLLIFQLHHAIGDGLSLFFVIQRFWEIFHGLNAAETVDNVALEGCSMTNKKIFKAAFLQHWRILPKIFLAKYRQLARRAHGLNYVGTQVGNPIVTTLRLPLLQLSNSYSASELFFMLVLAAIANIESEKIDKLIRLRIPVNMRKKFAINIRSIENACSAIPLEIKLSEIKAILKNKPTALGKIIQKNIHFLVDQGVPWNTLIECCLVEKLVTRKNLQQNAPKDILNPIRSNTLVTTYLGNLERYFKLASPYLMQLLGAHTSTWGVNSFTYKEYLYINFTAFDGVWNKQYLNYFAEIANNWAYQYLNIKGEIIL